MLCSFGMRHSIQSAVDVVVVTSPAASSPDTAASKESLAGIVATEQERLRLLMAEMLVRCLQQHLVTDEVFLKKAEALDAPGGLDKRTIAAKPPPTGLLPG
jgi:hypothetical protein